MDEEKRKAASSHSYCLRDQILKNEETKKQERLDYLEEGKKTREKIDEERNKIL